MEEIKVGDEVRYYHPVSKKMISGVVTGVDSDYHYAFLMKKDGDFCTVIFAGLVRTGRNFPQIKEVLNLLKENNEDGNDE